MTKCWRCRGDGYFYRVPDGFNPFSAGGWNTVRASYRVECYECGGTGVADGERMTWEEKP
jgi:hypothetical protein